MRFIISLLVGLFCLCASAQIKVSYAGGKKPVYKMGETLNLTILLKSNPHTCKDGMKQAKIFVSGLSIDAQTEWTLMRNGIWQKQLRLHVVDNQKGQAKLTVMRRVDKESLFQQETLKTAY